MNNEPVEPAAPLPENRSLILFADDDPGARDGLAELLRRRGFDVVCADDADEAALRLRDTEFDALLSDIHMPGNGGLELIAALPQVAAGLPVILLTGRPTIETAVRSVRLSVRAYLTKPADIEELTTLLDQAVEDRRAFRAMRLERDRLASWNRELEQIEQVLGKSPTETGAPMAGFLRVSLRNVILVLSDLEKAASSLESRAGAGGRLEHVAAIKRTVDVLQRTKQSFKSKELADLRHQLEGLLDRDQV